MTRRIPPHILATLDRTADWEVDTTPIPETTHDAPPARMVAVIVATGGVILHSHVEHSPSPEPADVARIMAEAVRDAIDATGFVPNTIVVRHEAVAAAMHAELGGPMVMAVPGFLGWADMLAGLIRQEATGSDDIPPAIATTREWAAWGLPPELTGRIFSAAATFYRGAPWDGPAGDYGVDLSCSNGSVWKALVLGGDGEELGLSLYESGDDLGAVCPTDDRDDEVGDASGMVISVLLQPLDDIPREMEREIVRAGWEVAGPGAYPTLLVMNTPGSGIPRRLAGEVAEVLQALGKWGEMAQQLPGELRAATFPWSDAETGVTIDVMHGRPLDPWELPSRLSPCGPAGPGARPGEWLADPDRDADTEAADVFLEAFAVHMDHSSVSGDVSERIAWNAQLFVDFLTGHQRIPVPAVTEFDLRTFLYDWVPRNFAGTKSEVMAIPPDLRRFFNFLGNSAGIDCHWAHQVLLDDYSFDVRWETLRGTPAFKPTEQDWRQLLDNDLLWRVMDPPDRLCPYRDCGDPMGPLEASLHVQLTRLRLQWRDEEVLVGVDGRLEVWGHCRGRTGAWAFAPQEAYGGRTPVEVVLEERRNGRP